MPAPEERADDASLARPERSLGARMVRGTLVQQAGLPIGIATGLIVTTALARSLSLAEFGVYGFVVALSSYLYFVIGTVETAAVNEMAAARELSDLEQAFSRSIVVYTALGVAAGLLIGIGGTLLVGLLSFSPPLTDQASKGALAVGALTAGGWTTKVFQDYLRATHRFGAASVSEALGNVVLAAFVVVAVSAGAPLWLIIAAGGALPLYVGTTAVAIVLVSGTRCRLRLRELTVAELVSFMGFSSRLMLFTASDFVVSSLDRTIVGLFRPAASLGLYEAAIKINNVVRGWAGNLSVTLIPVLSRTRADGSAQLERDLLVASIRYMLVAAVGPTVALIVLCDRLLATWLGPKYTAAAPTTIVFLVWWLIAPNFTGASALVIVSRKLRQLTIGAWATAAVNLVVSVALTAWLGLIGVAIGTLVGYLALSPYFISFAFAGRDVRVREVARRAWLPAYGLGLVLALLLIAVRLVVPLEHLWSIVVVIAVSVLGYWAAFFVFATDVAERAMLRSALGR